MTTLNHIEDQVLNQYVAGLLDDQQVEEIIAHLDECERCFEQLELKWELEPINKNLKELIPLDKQRGKRIERRLINRIHRSNLSAAVVGLGAQGFLLVTYAFLKPLLNKKKTAVSIQEEGDDD